VELSLQQIARALNGEVCNGQVLAPGPGHSAQDRSLSVKINGDDVLVHSFASDDQIACLKYVRDKCGIVFKPNGGKHRFTEADFERVAQAAAKALAAPKGKLGKLVGQYDYRDADGVLLYQQQRFDPKDFRPRRPDGKGWIPGLGTVKRVPYRLLELLKHPDATVFVCEGEKDADSVAYLDLCATTVISGKWTSDCVNALAGRNCWIVADCDEAGKKKALAVAAVLHGVANSIKIVHLPGLTGDKGLKDVTNWLDLGGTKDELIDACVNTPDWEPDTGTTAITDTVVIPKQEPDPPTAALPALRKTTEPAKAPPKTSPLCFVKIEDWLDRDPPTREWGVPDRFPLRNVGLISGEGSVGKSLLLMQLASAHIFAKGWLDTLPEPGDVIYLNAEDEQDELWRRFADLATFYNEPLSGFKDHLHLLAYAGKDAVLAHASKSGIVKATPLFDQLMQAAGDLKPKLIGLDTSADIFAGNESDRTQVRQFIGLLRGMSIAGNSSVIVCTHPSLTGISSGTGLSGSTAWHNSVRARAYLHKVTTTGDVEPDHTLRQLDFMKSNYGAVAASVTVRWKNGVYTMEAKPGSLEAIAADAKADEVFMTLLAAFMEQGRNVSDRPTSHNYAPTMFAAERRAKEANIKKPGLVAAMRRLFDARKIRVDNYGRPSRPYSRIVPCKGETP
jgi:RecA-family ATPase